MFAQLISALSYGTILFILASGLTVSLGLMGYFNLAHGAIFVFSGLVGYEVIYYTNNFTLALLASGITAGILGLSLERGFLRFLPGQIDNQVLLTIGVLFIIENVSLWIFGIEPRFPYTPPLVERTVDLFGSVVPLYRLLSVVIGILFFVGLLQFYKTKLGAIVRAGMDDPSMVKAMGINLTKIQVVIFSAASALAGVAAILAAPLMGISVFTSFDILTYAMIITVVGGAGSITGAYILSLVIALITAFGKIYFPEFAMFIIYLIMIVTLAVKPMGILGKRQV